MNNNLQSLNNYLFEQIERLSDDSLDEEKMNLQIERTKQVTNVAGKIIDINKMQLDALEKFSEYGVINQQQVTNYLTSGTVLNKKEEKNNG